MRNFFSFFICFSLCRILSFGKVSKNSPLFSVSPNAYRPWNKNFPGNRCNTGRLLIFPPTPWTPFSSQNTSFPVLLEKNRDKTFALQKKHCSYIGACFRSIFDGTFRHRGAKMFLVLAPRPPKKRSLNRHPSPLATRQFLSLFFYEAACCFPFFFRCYFVVHFHEGFPRTALRS